MTEPSESRDEALQRETEGRQRQLEQLSRLSTAAIEEHASLKERLDVILRVARQLMGWDRAVIFLPTRDQRHFEAAAWLMPDVDEAEMGELTVFPMDDQIPIITRVYQERRAIFLTEDAPVPREFRLGERYRHLKILRSRNPSVIPLLSRGRCVGVLAVDHKMSGRPIAESLDLLHSFAASAAAAVETARLFEELELRNRELSEALAQQTATSEILRVLSSSPSDVQPVLQAVAANASRLCAASDATIFRVEGDVLRPIARFGLKPGAVAAARDHLEINRGSAPGRAVLERQPVHIPDLLAEPAGEFPEARPFSLRFGHRSALAVPLLREGRALGAIAVRRTEVAPFSEQQIELLRTFADQAVIAIENARLFEELQTRNYEQARAVSELRALSEISQAVSSSLDLQTVLTRIVSEADQLIGTDGGVIYEYDPAGEAFNVRASFRLDPELAEELSVTPLRLGEGAVGRAGATRAPFQIADVLDEGAYLGRLAEAIIKSGVRALLAIPLLREGNLVGGLVMARNSAGAFPLAAVELMKTFAGQSSLAIQNARLFQEIDEKGRQLEIASRHKSEFLANMSHELRTPLNAIIGYSEMLQEEAEDRGETGFIPDLRHINSAGKHLLALINDILDLSKIEAGKMGLYLETFNVLDVLREIVAVVPPLIEKRGNRLEVRLDDELGLMVADLTKLRQGLFNLLSNAAKFTSKGTITLTARRETVDGRDWLGFTVSDTGIGIAPDQIGRLFQAFMQADVSTTREYGGTGLGLAITWHFCQMMGGDIGVESHEGKGTAFTIRLPARVEPPPAEPEQPEERDDEAPLTASSSVLVIDDDASVRDLLRRTLERDGFRVISAAGGEEGLRLARAASPIAITLDVMMPGMDGWAVLSALKGDPALAAIPVIMLSIVEDKSLGFALGASEYLTKPIDRERLLTLVRTYRQANHPRRALVIEDDPATRELLRRTLETDGWQVSEAEDGRAGLERVRESLPSLILLDLIMPEMDGFEFVEEFRGHPQWRDVPVLVVTARDLTEADHRRLNGHVERILQKGAQSRDALLAEVRGMVAASARVAPSRRLGEDSIV